MKVQDLDDRFSAIKEAYAASEGKISAFERLNTQYANSGLFLAVNGSLARKEMVAASDFDAFAILTGGAGEEKTHRLWDMAREITGLADPGTAGVFGKESIVPYAEILQNIGGSGDTNNKITQRMLLLLESIPVGDKECYDGLCEEVVGRYISDKITDHQLCLFLLNDIIRYYRTICVDFEFKTSEDGKPWGIRNIKLVYSRKLIYFSGVLMCAETAQSGYKKKREKVLSLMKLTPIERVLKVFGAQAFDALALYDKFLSCMARQETRDELSRIDKDNARQSDLFRDLKDGGHHFTWALRSAFMRHYDGTHPIHKAIMF